MTKLRLIITFVTLKSYHKPRLNIFIETMKYKYLALINRAGGLYGRILTSVVCTDLTGFSLYTQLRSRFSHTDQLSLFNKTLIIWHKQEQLNPFNVTGLY